MNQAAKTYVRTLSVSMIVYAVLLVATLLALPLAGQSPLRYLLVLLPVIPIGFGLRGFIQFLERMDELQQRIQLAGIAFAASVTGLLSFTYGFLELAGFPHLPWIWVFPAMIVLWGLGVALASRRYQ